MGIEDLAGRRYGPFAYRTCIEKVGEYAAATGEDPSRWRIEAPPALAGALLFVVAPSLLTAAAEAEPRAAVHGEQSFTWHRPIPVEDDLRVSGTVDRVRVRGPVAYVDFSLEVDGTSGRLVDGRSLFLLTTSADGATEEETEPPVDDPGPAGEGMRAASRADLIRYAAASRDWNPIHWDHATAVGAGLPGVVVHGLLQSAWLLQAAAPGPDDRVGTARFRYRAPLRPAVPAAVSREVDGSLVRLRLATGEDAVLSTAEVTLSPGRSSGFPRGGPAPYTGNSRGV